MNFNTGKRLKELRSLLCLSQSKLSEDASIDEKYYGRLERNESIPTVTTLEKICKALGISLVQFFMPASKILRQDPLSEYYIQKAQVDIMEYEIDLHFNRDVILKGCNNCIWYSGYIASAFLDEYEIRLTADGTVRAKMYENYKEVATINTQDASIELIKFFNNDEEMKSVLVKEDYSLEILQKMNGTVLFVPESNWLTLSIINRNTEELLDEFPLDTEVIYEPFINKGKELTKYIFFNFCNK